MKKIHYISLICLILLPLMTACSKPDPHISNINLINDLGKSAEINLCKDYLHCESLSHMWPSITIGINATKELTISNEVISIYRISTNTNGKAKEQCLRVKLDKSIQGYQDIALSTASNC